MVFRWFPAVFLFFFHCAAVFGASDVPVGSFLSKETAHFLSESGFKPEYHELAPTGQDEFAYNITVFFPAVTEDEAPDERAAERRNHVFFCFTQEDFFSRKDEIIEFMRKLSRIQHGYSLTFLFSAMDEHDILAGAGIPPTAVRGTRAFASALDTPDESCAVCVDFEPSAQNALYTGSYRNTTPLWLARRIVHSFFETKTPFSFPNFFSSMYRLGLASGKERLSEFMNQGIPAAEVSFSGTDGLDVLSYFAETYTAAGTEEWDSHYMFIFGKLLFRPVWISERITMFFCLAAVIFSIMILCTFSFIGKNGAQNKLDFLKSTYLIPATIGVSFLSLFLGQQAAELLSAAAHINPVIQYGIKIVFSLVFVSVLFGVHEFLKQSVTIFVYGYILNVISLFNIFLFSACDLMLFILFMTEYILIYLSQIARRLLPIILFSILMIIPFVPYTLVALLNPDSLFLEKLVLSSNSGNLLLAFAIFPFQIMWLRILARLNMYAKNKGYSVKKYIFSGAASMLSVLAFSAIALFGVSEYAYRPALRNEKALGARIQEDGQNRTISLKATKDEFSGMNTNHIHISSAENAVRYDVSLYGINTEHPVYDSIYTYTIESETIKPAQTDTDARQKRDIVKFIVPDFPPRNITIDYASDSSAQAVISVSAFYRTDTENVFRKEHKEITIE